MVARVTNQISGAVSGVAVTPSDTVNFTGGECRGLYVGAAGNVVVLLANDAAAVTFVGVSAGQILPVAALRVNATNTTASSIVALY